MNQYLTISLHVSRSSQVNHCIDISIAQYRFVIIFMKKGKYRYPYVKEALNIIKVKKTLFSYLKMLYDSKLTQKSDVVNFY